MGCIWATCIAVLLACGPAFAQEAPRFENLTVDDGLIDNSVMAIAQDGFGFIWLAGSEGLSRYDGHEVRTYIHRANDPHSLPHNDVRALAVDASGRLWIATLGGGLARYDMAHDRFDVWRARPDDPAGLQSDALTALAFEGERHLWIGTRNAGVAVLDLKSGTFSRFLPDPKAAGALRGSRVDDLLMSRDGTLWVAGAGHGLYRFDPTTKHFEEVLGRSQGGASTVDRRIRRLAEDARGRLWLGTSSGLVEWDRKAGRAIMHPGAPRGAVRDMVAADEGLWLSVPGEGLELFEPATGRTRVFRHRPTQRSSLLSPYTSALLIDRGGVLWIGTDMGASRLDRRHQAFRNYQVDPGRPGALPDDNTWAVGQRKDGSLWIATNGGGVVRFDPATDRWHQYRHDPADPGSLASDATQAVLVDSADRVWVGTADAGLDLYDPQHDQWIHHRARKGDPGSLFSDAVYAVRQARDGTIWVALEHGFDAIDPASGTISHPAVIEGDPDGGVLATIFDVAETPDGRVWVGSFLNGLFSLDPATRSWTKFRPDPQIPDSLGSMRVNVLLADRRGRLWAGTNAGLYRHLGTGNHWQRYGVAEGLGSDNISALCFDAAGRLWVGTTRGLSLLDVDTGRATTQRAEDGLPSSEISFHGVTELADGRLAIATANGFSIFDPSFKPPARTSAPNVVLTGLELFNRPVEINRPGAGRTSGGTDGAFRLDQSITTSKQLTLGYRQNLVSFELAALDFGRPAATRYAYRLEGWDKEWLETSAGRHTATYTNLPGGTYRLLIKAAPAGEDWGEPRSALQLTALPPPWKTWWAYTLYACLAISALAAVVIGLYRRAEAQRRRAEREEAINDQLRRIDRLKDDFLANTSHELRTPLHGMIGIAESLADGVTGRLPELTRSNLAMIIASGRRLSALINDLLDFSKLKHHTVALERSAVDLHPLVEVVLALSRPSARGKQLALVNQVPADFPLVEADEGRIEQVLFNLVGNAIKFTDSGSVTVTAAMAENGDAPGWVVLSVRDTGIGIAPEDQERVFLSFEQVEAGATRRFGGTGLGLAVSRQLVELHGGALTLESAPGVGSTFSLTLPVAASQATPGDVAAVAAAQPSMRAVEEAGAWEAALPQNPKASGPSENPVQSEDMPSERFTVLVVDDEPINRQVLRNHLLLEDYHVVEAAGGEEALAAFADATPDLVLLDVMMPRMSGFEVCRQLRQARGPADLPVIYLSARTQLADRLSGFESGASDYLTKPVAKAELVARVRTHLHLLDTHRNLEIKVAERTEELQRLNAILERLAAIDGLTGLMNRRRFDEAIEHAWADHQRRGAWLSILLVDIDFFKGFNDHYGHQHGDATLVAVAQALARGVERTVDVVARYGGEEFVLILSDTPPAGAQRVAAGLLDAVRSLRIEHVANQVAPHVTISIGVASEVPSESANPAELIASADAALYRAKETGRDRSVVAGSQGPSD